MSILKNMLAVLLPKWHNELAGAINMLNVSEREKKHNSDVGESQAA